MAETLITFTVQEVAQMQNPIKFGLCDSLPTHNEF